MKRILPAAAALVWLSLTHPSLIAQEHSPEGYWEGVIEIRQNPLEIAVRLRAGENGSWTGTVDIPVQRLHHGPLSDVLVEDGRVSFTIAGAPASPSFSGTLDEDGRTINGDFQQGDFHFPFRLRRAVPPAEDEDGPPSAFRQPGVPGETLPGIWLGVLDAGTLELRLVVRIQAEEDGYSGTIDSIDQGAKGLALTTVRVQDNTVHLGLTKPLAAFEGNFNQDRSQIAGEWHQGGAALPLTLHRQLEEPQVARPQDPKKPYPYHEEEVTFRNEAAGLQFAGTLTIPSSEGPHPAVVLLSGSGPQDRDESLMGHRPFLVLADYLTRQGIAVLRVDDRGVGGSQGNILTATTEDFAADARAAVDFLAARPQIDAARIGLVGHSEGAIVAPLAALPSDSDARSPGVAFLVLLAAPGLTGEETLYLQMQVLTRASGVDEEIIQWNREWQRRMFAIVKEETDDTKASERLLALRKELVDQLTTEQRETAGIGDQSAFAQQIKSLTTPWFRYFLTYDPALALARVRCPVLVIIGENDLQVPPAQNLSAIEKTLAAAGHPDHELVRSPRLNHLLQTSETGLPAEYARIEETIAPSVLEKVASWILQRAAKPAPPL